MVSGIGVKNRGYDYNYFNEIDVNWATYGGSTSDSSPDAIITFPTQGVMFLNKASSAIIQVSFNGNNTHLELDPNDITKALTFDHRIISLIWLRLKTGSTGPAKLQIIAWGKE